MNVKDRCYS